jgi:NAD(P)-dependent dehydrogenase (short-subunit alcohol dehydrogenase family)
MASAAPCAAGSQPKAPKPWWWPTLSMRLRSWEVNVMGHVYAARAVLPACCHVARAICCTRSAPRLAVTKHAALGLAESLSISYGDQGIKVSALCPMGVKTRMLERAEFGGGTFLLDDAIHPDEVAEAVIQGLDAERFLNAPHAKLLERLRRKADDYRSQHDPPQSALSRTLSE